MNAGEVMYALKPIITDMRITCDSSCMYGMKNIHDLRRNNDDHACKDRNIVNDLSEKVINFLKSPLPEVAILEARQEKILAQLAELKAQVLSLCDVLKVTAHEPTTQPEALADPVSLELVVNVHPDKPCHAIRALQKIWKDVAFRVDAHKHSSVIGDVPHVELTEKREFRDTVDICLIWKNVDDLEIVVSGIRGYPMIGESNMLRYIARQLPQKNYEKILSPREIVTLDSILDAAHRLQYHESPKDVQSTLTTIGDKLGKNNWFGPNDVPGIVDVAVWSAFKRTSIVKPPSILSDWFQRCEKLFIN